MIKTLNNSTLVPTAAVKLRPYQERAIKAAHDAWEDNQSTLIVQPTGTGKTVVFSSILQERLSMGRVIVVAHRDELIKQAARMIKRITCESADIEKAEQKADLNQFYRANVILSSVQTLISGKNEKRRMHKFDPDEFATLIIDEAHHVPAKSYRAVVDHFIQNKDLKVLGVTATPDRKDEKALGQIFDTVADVYEINDAIKDGWLVPIRQTLVHVSDLDFSSVRTTAGDLNGADLANIMEQEKVLHKLANPSIELCGDRKTLIFTVTVAQAERLAEIINRHKPEAARCVHGKTPKDERVELFADFASGKFQYLCNVGIATEGFDEPSIQCIVMARPTKSRALYAQMVGRGTRPLADILEGIEQPAKRRAIINRSAKPFCEVIDFVGNSGKHKLMTTADVLGGKYDDEVIALARKEVEEGGSADMMDALERAEQTLERKRKEEAEREKRKAVKATARYSTSAINAFDILDVTPERVRGWDQGIMATQKQIDTLEKFGVKADGMNRRHASQILDKAIGRMKHGWCSIKQAKLLKDKGLDPKGIRFEKASELITEIANNNWQVTPEMKLIYGTEVKLHPEAY